MLLHLGDDLVVAIRITNRELERVIELGKILGLELDVDDRADDLDDESDVICWCRSSNDLDLF